MANHVQSEKRARQTVRRTARNAARLNRVRTAVRHFRRALQGGDAQALRTALQVATRELRIAGSKGVLHARSVSRHVSRLTLAHNKVASSAASSA